MSGERCGVCGYARRASPGSPECNDSGSDGCVRDGYFREKARADSITAELTRVTAERDGAVQKERERCLAWASSCMRTSHAVLLGIASGEPVP